MSNANIAFIQSLYAAFGRGEIATIIAGLAPDVDWNVNGRHKDYPLLGSWKGPSEVQKFFKLVAETESFSDFSPKDFHAAGDTVLVLGHYAGAVKKTGRNFSCDWAHVFTVRGGKVVRFREYTDTAQFAEAYRG
jgi:ketosteroid isomerase-like protein